MKTGKSLIELAQELTRTKEAARDYIAPVERISMAVEDNKPVIQIENGSTTSVTPTPWAHSQIATFTEIPNGYYKRLAAEEPALLAQNVNHGLARQSGKGRQNMLRTVDGRLRALVSSHYKRLETVDFLETVIPPLMDQGYEIISCETTDTRTYIKALSPRVQGEVKKGDIVRAGVQLSTSEVGAGAQWIQTFLQRLVCLNGATAQKNTGGISRRHRGANLAYGNDAYELMTDRAKELADKAFWENVRQCVIESLDPSFFNAELALYRAAASDPITNFNLPEVVEIASRTLGVTGEKVKETVVNYLADGAQGAGLTRWGLLNGYTFAAQLNEVSYDDSIRMEAAASKLLHLPARQWNRIANAA